jgi:hypothetical protein
MYRSMTDDRELRRLREIATSLGSDAVETRRRERDADARARRAHGLTYELRHALTKQLVAVTVLAVSAALGAYAAGKPAPAPAAQAPTVGESRCLTTSNASSSSYTRFTTPER